MITVRTKPQYFNAHQWDGIAAKLDHDFEIVLLESLVSNDNLPIGAVVKNDRPIANVVQGHWVIFNQESVQIVDDEAFRAQFVEYSIVEAEWTTIAFLLPPPQSNE